MWSSGESMALRLAYPRFKFVMLFLAATEFSFLACNNQTSFLQPARTVHFVFCSHSQVALIVISYKVDTY